MFREGLTIPGKRRIKIAHHAEERSLLLDYIAVLRAYSDIYVGRRRALELTNIKEAHAIAPAR
jgi:hypothetical protein